VTRRPAAAYYSDMTFSAAAEQHLDEVYAYLAYLTGDRAAAEDLAAETFEKAFRLWRRFDPARGSVRVWLCQIARTTALDWLRAERRRRSRENVYALREVGPPAEPVFGEGLAPGLERALAALSPGEREVIALRVLLELEGRVAAALLGISETACSTRLSRALAKLEREVAEDVA
jgi:RNA polymerase sigma factor (sigma-70 family)